MTTPPLQTMKLRVTRNEAIADGINIVEFRDAGGNELPQFSAGAHIAIHAPNGMLRKYSLCNDPAERDRYQVAVKREINGRGGSCSLIDDVKAGDELMVIAPVNDFGLPPRAQEFLFIAGGIGVTPMMAMIWQVIAEGKRFRLFYCSRSPETTAFREELSAPQFKDMVTIYYDQGDPSRSLDLRPILAVRKNREHLYCCGPRPLMEAVRAMTDHWSPTAVHFEAFSEAETTSRMTSRSRCVSHAPARCSTFRPVRQSSKSCASTGSRCPVLAKRALAASVGQNCWLAKPIIAILFWPNTSARTRS